MNTLDDIQRERHRNRARITGAKNVLLGDKAFRAYDQYGLPLEMILDWAEEKGLVVDVDRFEHLLNEQRERSRAAQRKKGGGL